MNKLSKDLLLKSGIPLEVSVVKKLAKFKVCDFGEVEYARDGKLFTTDIDGKMEFNIFESIGISVNFVIECKYKTRNHQWFFMRFPHDKDSLREDTGNEIFDELLIPLLVKMGYNLQEDNVHLNLRRANLFDVKKVNKGVDILEDSFDPKIIREAISQCVFGSIKTQKDSIEYVTEVINEDALYLNKSDKLQWIVPVCCMSIPIVVTTATLLTGKKGLTLEQIEKAKDTSALYEEQKGVLLVYQDYLNLSRFSEQLFKNEPIVLSKGLKDWIASLKKSNEFFQALPTVLAPGYVYIINYKYFNELFSLCLEKIKKACGGFSKKIKSQ